MNMVHNVILLILFVTGTVFFIINERKNIKEWLIYAVVNAEKNIGSKLGQIKIRQVYNEFICKFPLVSKILPFWLFCSLPAFFRSLDAFSFVSMQYIVMAAGFFMFFVGRTMMRLRK